MKIPFYPKEYKALFRLGVPITVAQVGLTLQGFADTLMVGQHSAPELAAAGFVNSLMLLAILLTIGFALGAVSVIGMLYSQGKKAEAVSALKSSIIADTIQGFIITAFMVGVYFLLPHMGQDETLLPLMRSYFRILLPSLPFMFIGGAFKPFFDSINETKTPMWIMLVGNVWNVIFNWILIYGKLGFPEMGIDGAAWATTSSRVLILILFIVVFFFSPKYQSYRQHWHQVSSSIKEVLHLNKLGWPIAIQMAMEVASFSLVSLLIGWGGKNWDAISSLSAHQVMIQLANLIYMFYIGIGSAVAIRVSNYHGLHDYRNLRCAANAGYHMILLLGIVCTSAVFVFRHEVSGLFISSADPLIAAKVSEVVALTVYPMILYQFGDGMQTVYVNALRGFGDVKMLMLYSFIAYIVISFPLSYLFCNVLDFGTPGAWYAFPIGLTLAAILYLIRFRKVTDLAKRNG